MAIVTVCVLTYNPDWTKFQNTLKSIICQKGVDFDIVISDDGSKNNCFDKAEKYLKENNFSAYCFIANKQNQGTVKNTISALQIIKSKYVKLISPGDFLYDETVLAKFTDFAEKNPAAAYFGNAVYYSMDEHNGIKIHDNLYSPRDLKPWEEKKYKKIKRNYLYRFDFILGAALFCNRKKLLDYLLKTESYVKYAEDMSIVLMILSNEQIYYFDSFFVFYEWGIGVSTNTQSMDKVCLDIKNVFKHLYFDKKVSKFVLFLLNLHFDRTKSPKVLILKLIVKLFLDPLSLLQRFKSQPKIINMRDNILKIQSIIS